MHHFRIVATLTLAAAWLAVGELGAAEPAAAIKIGVNLPLSGNLAPFGKPLLEGAQLRIAEINAAGGVNGRLLELVTEDNKGDATETVNIVNKLAGSDQVAAIIGPVTSTNALAMRRTARELKIPVITPTATNDKVTQKNGWLFRACFNDSFQGTAVANHAARNLGAKRAAVLIDLNSDYSKGLCVSFKKAFTAAGGQLVAEESYQQKDTEFGPQLKKIRDCGADVLFVPGYPPELPLIIKQAKVAGVTARLCGADGWDTDAVVNGSGPNIAGSFIVGAFSPEDQRPVVRQFLAAYAAKGLGKPGTFDALGYDSVSLLAEAFKTGTGADAVRQGLLAIPGLEAVTGTIRFTPNGDAVKSAAILEIIRTGDRFATRYAATVTP